MNKLWIIDTSDNTLSDLSSNCNQDRTRIEFLFEKLMEKWEEQYWLFEIREITEDVKDKVSKIVEPNWFKFEVVKRLDIY